MRRAALALLIALAAVPAVAQTPYEAVRLPAPGVTRCPGGLCQPEALDPLFQALSATEAGERTAPVHILQIGDSHTAGDRITGRVRAVLQARFGNAGRGVLPAGVPYTGYAPLQVEVLAEDWRAVLAPLAQLGTYGVRGVGLTGVQRIEAGSEARLTLIPEPGVGPMTIGLCWEPPFAPTVGDEDETWTLEPGPGDQAAPGRLMCRGLHPVTRPQRLVLSAPDAEQRPVRLDHITLMNNSPGVVVSNLGVVGASLADLAARDEAVVADELAVWTPQLIILAYGTNEGFDDALDAVDYEALLRGQIERMRRLSPGSALMIIGAPDALRRGEPGGCSADGLRAPPPSLAMVRDVQRRVSAELGVAFWDWHGRMGGDCSADRLATMAEPLMRGDRVHFTSEGSDWIGGILADDLLAAYSSWKAGRAH